MSRSQFHSIKLFILRHAWLNLWDKHMTTGRINQVTVLSAGRKQVSPPLTQRGLESRRAWFCVWHEKSQKMVRMGWLTYCGSPSLTLWLFRHVSLHLTSDKATGTRWQRATRTALWSSVLGASYGNTNKLDITGANVYHGLANILNPYDYPTGNVYRLFIDHTSVQERQHEWLYECPWKSIGEWNQEVPEKGTNVNSSLQKLSRDGVTVNRTSDLSQVPILAVDLFQLFHGGHWS